LVLALFPMFTGRVFATSDYGVNLTDSLTVGGQGGTNTCTTQVLTQNVSDILDRTGTATNSYKNTFNYTNFSPWNAQSQLNSFADDYANHLVDGAGWGMAQISQQGYLPDDTGYSSHNKSIRIYLFSPSTTFSFSEPYGTGTGWFIVANAYVKYMDFFLNTDSSCRTQIDTSEGQLINQTMQINPNQVEFHFMATDNFTYPGDFLTSSRIPDTTVDVDGDGLSAALEWTQGTFDDSTHTDTDGDGISDYDESQWKLYRDETYCDTSGSPPYSSCAYPDPKVKDLYIEIDWMDDGVNDPYKPTDTQLDLVKDMFATHGIKFHYDTGQYGGGAVLTDYTQYVYDSPGSGHVDIYDYRDGGDGISANFATYRDNIWHYMIDGNEIQEDHNSTGFSYATFGESFVAGGRLATMGGIADMDRAVAGTIAHEIGHSLCLSDTSGPPTECVYGGIDNKVTNDPLFDLPNYKSVMNYRYQLADSNGMSGIEYSDGSHGTINDPDDHDDWSAVMANMYLFSSH
jgi:hypothetical protein